MKKTCIFQDTENIKHTLDLLAVAQAMYGRGQFESHAVLLDGPSDLLGWFDHITCVAQGLVAVFDPRGISDILENLHQRHQFDSILIPGTLLGKMIAPRLARRLRTGLVNGVTGIERQDNQVGGIRPACSGKVLETILHTGPGPVMMTIRLNAFEYTAKAGLQTKICRYTEPVRFPSAVKRLDVEETKQTRDVRDYAVLIAGGGGVKDFFPELYRLACALNGAVGVSRKLVDLGIAPRSIQVGQSGKTVSPRLYMALGIHGSAQHMAGLRQVESIISINTADTAPMCRVSDMVVHGDAQEFIEKLMKKIYSYKSENKET